MISQSLLPEFDQEMATTRKYLERFPGAQAGYKPHDKSMDMAALATHIAEMVGWAVPTINLDSLDLTGYQPARHDSSAALLEVFDKNLAAARAAIAATDDATWMRSWSLSGNGHTYFTMPKIAVMRGMILNHIIHHRAQLSVYYRINNVPVPATYGPSADER
jgi:uncharacterized damage-inducible protein DinB